MAVEYFLQGDAAAGTALIPTPDKDVVPGSQEEVDTEVEGDTELLEESNSSTQVDGDESRPLSTGSEAGEDFDGERVADDIQDEWQFELLNNLPSDTALALIEKLRDGERDRVRLGQAMARLESEKDKRAAEAVAEAKRQEKQAAVEEATKLASHARQESRSRGSGRIALAVQLAVTLAALWFLAFGHEAAPGASSDAVAETAVAGRFHAATGDASGCHASEAAERLARSPESGSDSGAGVTEPTPKDAEQLARSLELGSDSVAAVTELVPKAAEQLARSGVTEPTPAKQLETSPESKITSGAEVTEPTPKVAEQLARSLKSDSASGAGVTKSTPKDLAKKGANKHKGLHEKKESEEEDDEEDDDEDDEDDEDEDADEDDAE